MGGKVAVVARFKDNQTVAFKIHTSYLKDSLNTPKIYDENWLKQLIAKDELLKDDFLSEEDSSDYDNNKCVKAPYEYGIVLIDYVGRSIVSANNYIGMLTGNSANIDMQYMKSLYSNFNASLQEKEKITKYDLRESLFFDLYASHYIAHALRHNAVIKRNGKVVVHNGTIESVVGAIYDLPLENKTKEQQLEILEVHNNKKFEQRDFRFKHDEYGDISFEYSDFSVIEGDGADDVEIILEYMQHNSFVLSNYEKTIWQQFIDKKKS